MIQRYVIVRDKAELYAYPIDNKDAAIQKFLYLVTSTGKRLFDFEGFPVYQNYGAVANTINNGSSIWDYDFNYCIYITECVPKNCIIIEKCDDIV